MDEKELARGVAAELGVLAETQDALDGKATRALGFSEAMALGGFLASCAHVAIEVWRVRQDRALLLQALVENDAIEPRVAAKLNAEKRLSLVGRIVDRLVPDSIDASPSLGKATPRNKSGWIREWLSQRTLTHTVLMPFADMDNYIVYEPISWSPGPSDVHKLPNVTVPKGFVTDLATIPNYFWWIAPPHGRYGHAAILHDWLYWNQSSSREVADRVFDVVMQELEVGVSFRKTMWAAVRVYGGKYWENDANEKRHGGKRVLKAFPNSPAVTWEQWRLEPDVLE